MNFERLSASSIKLFLQCPLHFFLKYDQKVETEDTPHPLTLMGSGEHFMFEQASLAYLGKTKGSKDPLAYLDEAVTKHKVDQEHVGLMKELANNALQWGYFRQSERMVNVEWEFIFELSEGTKVKGFVDRLDKWKNTADIIDLKTQKKEFSQEELVDNWQAKIYNIAVREFHPDVTDPLYVSFWVLRHRVQKVIMTAEDAVKHKNELLCVSGQIRAEQNPQPCPTALCQWCDCSKHCPMGGAGIKKKFNKRTKGTVVFK